MRQTFFNVTSLRGPCVRKRGTVVPTGVAYLYRRALPLPPSSYCPCLLSLKKTGGDVPVIQKNGCPTLYSFQPHTILKGLCSEPSSPHGLLLFLLKIDKSF